jgi:hypothetical protein
MLENVVTQFMHENLLQHEAPEGIGWPIHQGSCQLGHKADHRSGPFKTPKGLVSKQSRQSPRRQRLFKKENSARNFVSAENQ